MKLIPIDLSKGDSEHNHPDINTRSWFLAKIKFDDDQGSLFLVGKFSKQWYGYHFDCDWGCSGLQYDTPGYNSSCWNRLWRVQGANSQDAILATLMRAGIKAMKSA